MALGVAAVVRPVPFDAFPIHLNPLAFGSESAASVMVRESAIGVGATARLALGCAVIRWRSNVV
jgi:hypothetical protein